MKRKMLFLLVLAACLLASAALAASLTDDEFTDVPTMLTQDSVLELRAGEECVAEALAPDAQTMALLRDVYEFVWVEENRPARYYDEETQRKITDLVGGMDIDLLLMTEAMRFQLTGDPEKAVTVEMLLDVEYRVGQLIVAVLGVPQGDGEYVWYPYRGRVEELGEIKWDIPLADWPLLCAQPISLHVMTDRIGPRGERLMHEERYVEHYEIFSKDSGDVIITRRWYTVTGETIGNDFRVMLEPLNALMQREVGRIGDHLEEGGTILDYFPEDRRDEALLMVPVNVDPATLIPYDVIAMRVENYMEPYGDVNVEMLFGTDYQPEKAMVVLAGFPIREAVEAPFVEWFVLRAETVDLPEDEADPVVIGLKQLNLTRMEEEPLMLVVISEPVVQE